MPKLEEINFSTNPDYVEVTFISNSTVKQVAPSPTRKVANYGYLAHGVALFVHKDDQKALSSRYKLTAKPKRQRRTRKK